MTTRLRGTLAALAFYVATDVFEANFLHPHDEPVLAEGATSFDGWWLSEVEVRVP